MANGKIIKVVLFSPAHNSGIDQGVVVGACGGLQFLWNVILLGVYGGLDFISRVRFVLPK